MLWRQLLKAFQRQETLSSHLRNVQQEQRSLTICWLTWMVFQPFPSFARDSLPAYTLPPPRWAHVDCQKAGNRLIERWRRLQKPSMGTCGQGWAANSTQYISPEMSSHDCACTLTQKPCNLFTGPQQHIGATLVFIRCLVPVIELFSLFSPMKTAPSQDKLFSHIEAGKTALFREQHTVWTPNLHQCVAEDL